jgi:UDP-arabinose 4-epimerase
MKRILVTGGAGYIGSHTAKVLAQHGYSPVVLDNLSNGHRWAVRYGPLVVGDIDDQKLLRRLIHQYEIESVLHFAALAYVGDSMRAPGRYFRNNISATITMLDTLVDAGVRNLVFSSTCATYGLPEREKIDEAHSQIPINPYGESKLAVEKMLKWFQNAHGLRHVSLRYFNAAGADPECELGEEHNPETHLIPLVLQTANGQRPTVSVFGQEYPTEDGSAVRDYVHVTDLADAHLRALRYLWRGGEHSAFNLGTGTGHSVLEVVQCAEAVTGRPVRVSRDAPRPGDPPRLVADATLAREELGWRPRYSELETIVSTGWEWLMSQQRPFIAAAGARG